ncbi:MAG: hypothetical protein DRN05_02215 [Thermoplasmata archaeon]|nr:MAG: hypothetical protein DRN05_02215 [Thermoplasmata archaeon]
MDRKKSVSIRDIFPVVLMGCLFVFINYLALLISKPFEASNMAAFDNPDDPMNLILILFILLFFTILILMITKFWRKQLIQIIILGAVGYTAFYVFLPIFAIILPYLLSVFFSIAVAAVAVSALFRYPEWYVIDVCGVVIGAGAIAIFGISLSIPLIIVLLIVLALYDAFSVYKTGHMIDIADAVMDLKLPVMLVVPKIRHYSLLKEKKSLREKLRDGEERDAFFMGLGDVVMPGILSVAVYNSVENGFILAMFTIAGALAGFILLMIFVVKGKPQAGLPFLCSGSILGYVLSSFLLFGKIWGFSLLI